MRISYVTNIFHPSQFDEIFSTFSYLLALVCSVNDTFVCTTLFSTTLDLGSSRFSSSVPAVYNFSTTYEQKFSPNVDNEQFAFVSSISSLGQWHARSVDHTPNDTDGYMFLINSGWSATEMYCRTMTNLYVGLRYEFSFFAANVVEPSIFGNVAPNLQISVLSAGVNQAVLFVFSTGLFGFYSSMI